MSGGIFHNLHSNGQFTKLLSKIEENICSLFLQLALLDENFDYRRKIFLSAHYSRVSCDPSVTNFV